MMTAILAVGVTTGIFVLLAVLLLVSERYLANYGEVKIDINAGARVYEREGGGTLLSALYESKIFIPSACGGKGSCGYCKVTVTSGGGPILPTELPFMTRTEARSGVRLACQMKVKQDMEIHIPEDLLSVKLFSSRVGVIRDLTHDIKEINLELIEPAEIIHHPGQYIQIEAPSDDGPVHRAYSISSSVSESHKVQLIVRLVPGGIASTYLHNLEEGDNVTFTGPYGEFRLSTDPAEEIILVGGGCGMAPVKDIAYSALEKWPERRIQLFFGARTTEDIFYLEEFEKLREKHPSFNVVYALSDPLGEDEQWTGETGFVHLSVDKHLQKPMKRQAFLCGPPPMIDAVTEILQEKGLSETDIFYDKF